MSVYTVGNLKGGVGKTTLAFNLAVTLANSKRDVLLIDAEGPALIFTGIREQAKGVAGYTAVSLQGAHIRTQVRQLKPKYDDIVIDIGGEDESGSLRAALTVSDTILIPLKPRSVDVWKTEDTVELVAEAREINEALRAVAVINEADPQGKDNDETLAALREMKGLEIAPVMIGRRKAFPNAAAKGLSVLEYHEDLKATDEMLQLVEFLSFPPVHSTDIQKVSHGNR